MRKLLTGVVLTLLLAVGIAPATAQGTIADAVASNDDFSLLNELVETADPAVAETLSGSGNYTVLAPNNQAIRNLASFLDMSLEDIQANPDIVTDLLLYHVIDGEFTAADITAQYDGGVVETLLDDTFVNFDVLEDGIVQINDTVEVIQADVQASNGVVHVINDVLLNRVITDQLDDVDLADTSQNDDTADDSADDSADETDTMQMAGLRLLYGLAGTNGTDGLDVLIDGEPVLTDVQPGTLSEFVMLEPGDLTLSVSATGQGDEAAIYGPIATTFETGTYTTLALVGLPLNVQRIVETYDALPEGEAGLTVLHSIQDGPAVNIVADDNALVSDLAFSESASATVPAGSYEVAVNVAESGDTLLGPATLELAANTYTFVAAAPNSDGNPQLIVATTPADVTGDSMDDMGDEASMDGESDNEIDDIIATNDDLQTLLEVVQAADSSILNALGSSGPYTLLAPSNQAFTNLLVSYDLSLSALAAQPELLTQILQYHVLADEYTAADLAGLDGESVETLLDDAAIAISAGDDGSISFNGVVGVSEADISADNGTIHIVDNVLLPQPAIEALEGN